MLASHVVKAGYYLLPQIKLLDKHERWKRVARLLKLSSNAYLRLEWLIYYHTKAGKNAKLTCRHFGIPGKTFYKWKNRFDEQNLHTLEDQSKAPIRRRGKDGMSGS